MKGIMCVFWIPALHRLTSLRYVVSHLLSYRGEKDRWRGDEPSHGKRSIVQWISTSTCGRRAGCRVRRFRLKFFFCFTSVSHFLAKISHQLIRFFRFPYLFLLCLASIFFFSLRYFSSFRLRIFLSFLFAPVFSFSLPRMADRAGSLPRPVQARIVLAWHTVQSWNS